MDEEVRRHNAGAWPGLAVKRQQTLRITAEASVLENVLLAYSVLDDEGLDLLRARGWHLALLDLPESVMRSRAEAREREEGWTNIRWLPFHLDNVAHLRQMDAFATVLDATRPVTELVAAITTLMRA
jgi:hypothetical protein